MGRFLGAINRGDLRGVGFFLGVPLPRVGVTFPLVGVILPRIGVALPLDKGEAAIITFPFTVDLGDFGDAPALRLGVKTPETLRGLPGVGGPGLWYTGPLRVFRKQRRGFFYK